MIMFFFSSRRRHTRFDCDWSSDVCSSDLGNCACHRDGCESVRAHPEVPARSSREECRAWAENCRSEEHTSELQSQSNLVCRLLLEKKKNESYSVAFRVDLLPPSSLLHTAL